MVRAPALEHFVIDACAQLVHIDTGRFETAVRSKGEAAAPAQSRQVLQILAVCVSFVEFLEGLPDEAALTATVLEEWRSGLPESEIKDFLKSLLPAALATAEVVVLWMAKTATPAATAKTATPAATTDPLLPFFEANDARQRKHGLSEFTEADKVGALMFVSPVGTFVDKLLVLGWGACVYICVCICVSVCICVCFAPAPLTRPLRLKQLATQNPFLESPWYRTAPRQPSVGESAKRCLKIPTRTMKTICHATE